MVVRELDAQTFRLVARLLMDHLELTETRAMRPEAVRPRSAAGVVALLNAGVITLAEARRYLRLGRNEEVDGPCG